MDLIPPIFAVISTAIAVVTDFVNREGNNSSDIPNNFADINIPVIPIELPIAMLINITARFALSMGRFLYIGRAKTTVAGPTRAFMNLQFSFYIYSV